VLSLARRDIALTVGNYGRTASIYNLKSQSGRFGLLLEDASEEIDQFIAVVQQWRESFPRCGVSLQDVDYIAPAMLPRCFIFEARAMEKG
jgi:serine/threonine-protein kinase HipA